MNNLERIEQHFKDSIETKQKALQALPQAIEDAAQVMIDDAPQ